MKKLMIIFLILSLTACEDPLATDTEVEAVQSVLDFYGGLCNRSKGFKTKAGETETYFELEMSQSELIESYANMIEMPASNIAYLFYSNLENEQEHYTHVKVKINLSNGQSTEYYYSANDLKEVEKLVPVLQTVSDKIKSQDYVSLQAEFDEDVALELTAEGLQAFCMPYDSTYGKVDQTQFQGFSYFELEENNRALVHLIGIMMRENGNTPISLFVDRQSKKVVTIKYEF